jgi:glutamyl-tRNA reductase
VAATVNLLSVGISHHTAALEVRERMWMSTEESREAVKHLRDRYFSECLLVSTCNRTEVYGIVPDNNVDDLGVTKYLIELKGVSGNVQPEHFYHDLGGAAVQHLFRVASGVDSLVVGDIQILNQVKEAYNLSTEVDSVGPVMNRLLQSALHVGKRTRSETSICEGAVSVSYAAVELANKIFADLTRKSALLVGAGGTSELTMKHLVGRGVGHIKVANRTREKAEALLRSLGVDGEVVEYDQRVDALHNVDIVITSVDSPGYVLQPADLQKVIKQRASNPLFVIDIGVPRNVDPGCNKVGNVFLYDMDSLGAIVDKNLELRKAEIPKVTKIIEEEMTEFFHWYNSLQVAPTIQDLRESFELIRVQEVEKNINRFNPKDRELVDLLTKRILNKILHQPITNLKQTAEGGKNSRETLVRIKTLRDLFGIARFRRDGDDL